MKTELIELDPLGKDVAVKNIKGLGLPLELGSTCSGCAARAKTPRKGRKVMMT